MHDEPIDHGQRPDPQSYLIGFGISVVLTLCAFGIVLLQLLSGWTLTLAITVLAVAQLYTQLYYFLHLGKESKPQWNLLVFVFMLIVVVILVFGSLWIMKNLHYNTMTPQQTDQTIIQDEGVAPKMQEHKMQ